MTVPEQQLGDFPFTLRCDGQPVARIVCMDDGLDPQHEGVVYDLAVALQQSTDPLVTVTDERYAEGSEFHTVASFEHLREPEHGLPPSWCLAAEYDGQTTYSGPYTREDAIALKDYAMGEGMPMGECVVEMFRLLPPLDVQETISER